MAAISKASRTGWICHRWVRRQSTGGGLGAGGGSGPACSGGAPAARADGAGAPAMRDSAMPTGYRKNRGRVAADSSRFDRHEGLAEVVDGDEIVQAVLVALAHQAGV